MPEWMYYLRNGPGMVRYADRIITGASRTLGHAAGAGNIVSGGYNETVAYDGRTEYRANRYQTAAIGSRMQLEAVQAQYAAAHGGQVAGTRGQGGAQAPGDDGPLVARVVQGIAELGQLENDPRLRGQTQRIVEAMRIDAGPDGRYNLSQGVGVQIAGRDIRVPAGSYTPAELANQIAPQFGVSPARDAALSAAFGGQAQAPAAGQGQTQRPAQPAPAGAGGQQVAGGAGSPAPSATPRPAPAATAGVEPIDPAIQRQLQNLGLETQGSKYYAAVEQAKKEGKDPSTVEMDGMKGNNTTKAIIAAQRAIKEKHPEVDVGPDGTASLAFKAALDAHAAELATPEGKTLLDKHRGQIGAALARQAAATPRTASPTLASLDPADQAARLQAIQTVLNEPLNLGTGGQTVQTNDAPIGPNNRFASNDLGAGSRA